MSVYVADGWLPTWIAALLFTRRLGRELNCPGGPSI